MQIYTAIIQLFHYLASINSNSFNNGIIIINITYSRESKYETYTSHSQYRERKFILDSTILNNYLQLHYY